MLEFLRRHKLFPPEGSYDRESGVVYRPIGWLTFSSSDLLPALHTHLIPSGLPGQIRFTGSVTDVQPHAVTLKVQAFLPEEGDAALEPAFRYYKGGQNGILNLPWNQERDGEFIGLRGEKIHGAFSGDGRINYLGIVSHFEAAQHKRQG